MYFDPRYAKAHRLRANAARELSSRDRGRVKRIGMIPGMRHVFNYILFLVERALPGDPEVDAFVARHAPDILLISPLVVFNSPQVEYIKAARKLGIPCALCVASWDNLTNKGRMRDLPDRVFVWNEAQAEEATTLHGMPRDRIVVTGAQSFDQWFKFQPSQSREAFLRERGLDPDTDLILYLCSSTSISPDEIEFVREWHDAIRSSRDPRVARAAILVRPHPMNNQPWERLDLLGLPNFSIWPRDTYTSFNRAGRRNYFDSMYHAAAVVGLNTSGQVEAGIVGKPVLTLLSKDIPRTLRGTTDTLHFQHLLNFNGGLLHVAGSFAEHIDHLAKAMSGVSGMVERSRRFTEAFIRPHGIDRPATPILVDAIRSLLTVKPRQPAVDRIILGPLLRPVLKALALRPAKSVRRHKAGGPLIADINVADHGGQVTAKVYYNKVSRDAQKPILAESLFDSAEGHRRLVVRLYPYSCTLKLDWEDGDLVDVRVEGAFSKPSGEDSAGASIRLGDTRRSGNSGAVSPGIFEKDPTIDLGYSLDRLRDEVVGSLRQEILNAASGIVAAAWDTRAVHRRVDAALPLILIAQIQRSGGTLLSQLFDGHPEIWAFPQELKWGGEVKYRWPTVEPLKEGPLQIARSLVAANLEGSKVYSLFGYQKQGTADRDQRLPFKWSQWAYVEAFLDSWEAKRPQSRRQCLDIFMSAYFSAFLDWHGSGEAKKIITAFTPRVNFTGSYPENEGFFDDYPDGAMISICRHPSDWYASAARHESKYVEVDQALAQWRESAESSLRLKERHPDRVMLVSFSALVTDPHNTMKRISQRLGLTWHPILTVPTFNSMPISSNSSFNSVVGIDSAVVTRRDLVPENIRERIEADHLALYKGFIEAADVK
jgi:hypothetical protein